MARQSGTFNGVWSRSATTIPPGELGSFGPTTERELRAFQEHRALRVDGICGRETWTALVESGFRLGDRMLYVRRPMLRGDDVVELQRRLNTLGFDAGKEDGIFGPDTAGALSEFQRNAGLGCDGIFGPDTADALARIGALKIGTLAEGSVASVREREALRRGPHRIEGRRVFLAVAPGFGALADRLMQGPPRGRRHRGARLLRHRRLGAGRGGEPLRRRPLLRRPARRRARVPVQLLRLGPVPLRGRLSGRDRGERRAAGGAARSRPTSAGAATRRCARRSMAAVLCEPAAHDDVAATRRLVTGGGDVARAIVVGIRRGVEEPARPRRVS